MQRTQLLVIGAGPYGLSIAAYARRRGLDPLVIGEPMGFWKHHMPPGMLLRSGLDWHLDAAGERTLEAYLEQREAAPSDVDPIPLAFYLEYVEWFRTGAGVEVRDERVSELRHVDGRFEAELESGGAVAADAVVATPGMRDFPRLPDRLEHVLPRERYSHTSELVHFERLGGRRCLIVGGRQSAFESAALMHEHGVAEVHVLFRHDTPRFAAADWSFVDPLMERTLATPGWFRGLPAEQKERLARRFWSEGRLKLEPWLWPRLEAGRVRLWPRTEVSAWRSLPGGEVEATVSSGERLVVDHVLFATGYQVDVGRVGYLAATGLADELEVVDRVPVLDDGFGASVPGLFFAGFVATRDFGPFFGFTRGCPVAARLIVGRLVEEQPGARHDGPGERHAGRGVDTAERVA